MLMFRDLSIFPGIVILIFRYMPPDTVGCLTKVIQKIRETVRRAPKRQNAPNRLTGLLYCADCGSKLTHRYTLVQGKWIEDAFICSGYRHLIHDCTMHHIPTAKIEAAILAVIQRVSWYVRHKEKPYD